MRIPYAAIVLGAALVLPTSANALFPGVVPAGKCTAAKLQCIAKATSCLLGCNAKALRAGGVPNPTCLDACLERLVADPAVAGQGCFARAERLGDCTRVGDAPTMSAAIDAHVTELIAALASVAGAPANRCTSDKTRCVAKYDACVLRLAAKAAKTGTAIGALDECGRILDGSAESCVGKRERRYCDPAVPGCDSAGPACLTYGDEQRLRAWDDAFVDETIVALATAARDVNTQRCTGDTAVRCTSAPGGTAGCGGPLGTCELFFGAPAGQNWGGIPICLTTQWNGTSTGTYDQATGALAGVATLRAGIHVGGTTDHPCPACSGDLVPNDGVAAGLCSSGPHAGAACDGNDPSPEPAFGTTSLDCPPPAPSLLATMRLTLALDTGTVTKTVGATSPNCNGAPGRKCLCASCSLDSHVACESDAECAAAAAGTCTSPAGNPRQPNVCNDGICTPAHGGDGVCAAGPTLGHCLAETFRGCVFDGDCPAPNDHCTDAPVPCYAGYDGNVGDAVTATGRLGARRNGVASATVAAVFCLPPAWNFLDAGGLPGPGRIEVGGIVADDGGAACPTVATFLPTARGPATDIGWTGFAHDQKRLGGAKITFATACTGTSPSCSCAFAGPVANANAAP